MKTKLTFIFTCALFTLFSACTNKIPANLSGLVLNYETIELAKGQTFDLKVTPVPEEAEITDLVWSSSDENVAMVDASGKVIAFTTGQADITAAASGKSAVCHVTVVPVTVSHVEITPPVLTLTRGETTALTAKILPDNADEKTILWESADETVAQVDQQGNVTALSAGETTIMASAGGKTGICQLTVTGKDVESITLNTDKATVLPGEIVTLSVSIYPEDAEHSGIVWETTDNTVASVNDEGEVTAVSPGVATISATVGELSDVCVITVLAPPVKGDFFYSDGTYSSELDDTKTPIGIVYWIGDPTETDPALKRDHPECTHGLVVALNEPTDAGEFSGDETTYWQKTPSSVSDWITINAPEYLPTATEAYGEGSEKLNLILGYNNTKAMELFNAEEGNYMMTVEAVQRVVKWRETDPAPENTSDWYVPSAKEVSLFWNGELSDSIYGNSESDGTIDMVNEKIYSAGGTEIDTWHRYWSSTEYTDPQFAFYVSGQTMFQKKTDVYSFVRFVLAF